jgi:tellurite resistance protein TerC
MVFADIAPWAALVAALFVFLWLDLHFFARGRDPGFKESAIWSVGWLVLGLLMALVVYAFKGGNDAVVYTTVYLIERSLSLDNLFVFLLLFAYFGVPHLCRPRVLYWGIVGALVLRGGFILSGTALISKFQFLLYVLGVLLLVLAYRIFKGVDENVDPDRNLLVRLVRRVYPVTGEFHGKEWFVKTGGTRYATPLFLCLAAVVFADVAFAIDSIPAAFAITRDPFLIWMGNVFALLGLRSLFVLVESLIARFRYLDETIAVVLGLVAVKLLIEDLVHIGPLASLAGIAAAFAIGIGLSLRGDRKDPDSEEKRDERMRTLTEGAEGNGQDGGGSSGVGGGAVGQQAGEAQ